MKDPSWGGFGGIVGDLVAISFISDMSMVTSFLAINIVAILQHVAIGLVTIPRAAMD